MEAVTTIKIPKRHEIKHQISSLDDLVLQRRISKVLKHDDHNDGIYYVTSLYFDSLDDDVLKEKIDGHKKRAKYRLRYYEDDTSYIKLEKKYKDKDLSGKVSTLITYEEVKMILAGEYAFLLDGDPLKIELYTKLKAGFRPKSLVRYKREAFIYPYGNIRITFDRNIKISNAYMSFLDPDHHYMRLMSDTILEVKYDNYLPDIVRMLVNMDTRHNAYSKYAQSRRFY